MVAAPAKRHCSVCGRGPRTGHEATGSSERPNGERTCRHCHVERLGVDAPYRRYANGLDLFIAPQDGHIVETVKIERVFIERAPRDLRELIRRAVDLLDARATLEAEHLHDSVRALDAEGPVHLQHLCQRMKVISDEAEHEFKDGQTALELDLDGC